MQDADDPDALRGWRVEKNIVAERKASQLRPECGSRRAKAGIVGKHPQLFIEAIDQCVGRGDIVSCNIGPDARRIAKRRT